MTLTVDQQQAKDQFKTFLMDDTSEMVLAGHSGSGKSYLVDELIQETEAINKTFSLLNIDKDINIHCTATTNQAAKVLSLKTGRSAGTIHSLIGLTVKDDYKTGQTSLKKNRDYDILKDSLIILDEASMISTYLLKIVRESLMNCKILYVGDPYQLPPVFETSCPVFDSVQNQAVLTTIKRQDSGSGIIDLGEEYRQCLLTKQFPDIYKPRNNIKHMTGPEFKDAINQEFSKPHNSKILAWENTKVNQYNKHVRTLTVPPEFHDKYMVGERVITNKPILSSTSGVSYPTDTVCEITHLNEATYQDFEGYEIELDHSVLVFLPKKQYEVNTVMKTHARNKNWKEYFELKNHVADLRPIHACTVHKSQGSTFDNVYIDLTSIGRNNKWNEVARLLYVAITRASNTVYLYGSLPARYLP